MPADPRITALCSDSAQKAFHAVAAQHEVWKTGSYDVEAVHREAREVFRQQVRLAATPPGLAAGRIFALPGEAGSGKTHLMQAFRDYVHSRQLGYFVYLRLSAGSPDYGRYLLSKTIDALEQPYRGEADISGLVRLSGTLVLRVTGEKSLELLRSSPMLDEVRKLQTLVEKTADKILSSTDFSGLDVDLLRALLYVQRESGGFRSRALKYLRGEPLTPRDQNMLGGIAPRRDDALRMLTNLGKLMWAVGGQVPVFCLDQLDDIARFADSGQRFQHIIGTVCELIDEIPSSLFVLAVVENLYDELKQRLFPAQLDRLEFSPPPVRLHGGWEDTATIKALVGQRLHAVYAAHGLATEGDLFPFDEAFFNAQTGLRAREILANCQARLATLCQRDAAIPAAAAQAVPAGPDYASRWTAFLNGYAFEMPDMALNTLLQYALETWGTEQNRELTTGTETAYISVHLPGEPDKYVGLCNDTAMGSRLHKQIDTLETQAGTRRPVAVRCTEFPNNKTTKIFARLEAFVQAGGRLVVVRHSEWRIMRALQDFQTQEAQAADYDDAAFRAWLRHEQPLGQLPALQRFF